MKSIRTISAAALLLAGLMAFHAGKAHAASTWRLQQEDRRLRTILDEMTRAAYTKVTQARQAAGRVSQVGRTSDPNWKSRESANARDAMFQYKMAIQAFVNLRAEAGGYVRWCERVRNLISTDINGGQSLIRTCNREIQSLQTESNNLRTYWYRLGLSF